MEFKRRKHNHAHVNVAPLVDVVFLLLLFFMLTSHLVREPALRIQLPGSKTAETTRDHVKTITITKDGIIYFMDKRVDIGNLRKALIDSFADPENDFVRIRADREADVGLLVNVIDEVKLSGIAHFSIVAERK